MAVSFSGSMVSALASDIVNSAYWELNAIAADETVSTTDLNWAVEKLQRIIDQWNARREMFFSRTFQQYTLTPNHAPHTIGPSGDLQAGPAANYRPLRIVSASFVLNAGTSNPVDTPIRIRDKEWWAGNPVKSQQNAIVTDLFYDPAIPNGTLNFWPVCNLAGVVRLELENSIGQALTSGTTLAFAQGYWEALILTLAISLCSGLKIAPDPTLVLRQREAVKVIIGNNDAPPRIDTGSGMPNARSGKRPTFNFLTGLNE